MIHRPVLALLFAGCIATATASDELHWNGAGWYGVADATDWGWIETGPYQDEATCDASLPPDNEDVTFACEYLATKPDWD